ncbi:ABC transporter substrate-binding protein [Halobacterium noricense]|uniref:ABC transporter substrate-binding protein n=1 Tax=Halobacterium noricense TaxID=223182 RepID=UPI001E37C441|nr:ABC transporter substrate-binding protein [Halobacterium noricense]UHH24785.1 ABC transporter substrate-binding protein [Halobacterium noricense]
MTHGSNQVSRRGVLKASGAAGLFGLAGCIDSGSSSGTTVVHGTTQGGTTGVITSVVENQGFDADHGIDLDLKQFTDPPQVQNQLALSDDVPTGYMGSIIATRMHAENNPMKLVGPYMYYHAYVLARSDSDIDGPSDLAGKRISYGNEAADAWLKFAVLLAETHGITPDQYEFVQSAPPAALPLLDRGEVDAILSFEPILTKGLTQYDFDVVFSPRDAWRETEDLPLTTVDLAVTQSWYENNADTTSDLAATLLDAQRHLSENIDSVIENNPSTFGFESDAAINLGKERMDQIYPTEWNEDSFVESELRMVEKANELGMIDAAPTEDIFEWVM